MPVKENSQERNVIACNQVRIQDLCIGAQARFCRHRAAESRRQQKFGPKNCGGGAGPQGLPLRSAPGNVVNDTPSMAGQYLDARPLQELPVPSQRNTPVSLYPPSKIYILPIHNRNNVSLNIDLHTTYINFQSYMAKF